MSHRRLSLRPAKLSLHRALTTTYRIWGPVRESCVWSYESINESAFQPRVAAKVVGLAFLSAVVAWEEFVEETFLRFMAGASSPSGYAPDLRIGPCRSRAHALQALTGSAHVGEAARRTRWSDYEWVAQVAGVHFQRAHPFSRVPALFRQRIIDAQIIRNRVAHNSPKAKRHFKTMANRAIGKPPTAPLPNGFSPGRFLVMPCPRKYFDRSWLESQDHHWGDVFEAFLSMFFDLSDILAP